MKLDINLRHAFLFFLSCRSIKLVDSWCIEFDNGFVLHQQFRLWTPFHEESMSSWSSLIKIPVALTRKIMMRSYHNSAPLSCRDISQNVTRFSYTLCGEYRMMRWRYSRLLLGIFDWVISNELIFRSSHFLIRLVLVTKQLRDRGYFVLTDQIWPVT